MSELAKFLLARFAEDETLAMAARHTRIDCPTPEGTDWIEALGPGRTLAECEAKRRIVALHRRTNYLPGDNPDDRCLACAEWPCPTLELLALPYANHPDYRPEWRP